MRSFGHNVTRSRLPCTGRPALRGHGTTATRSTVVHPYIVFDAVPSVMFTSTATTETVTGLTNGTTCRFKVAAINAVGVSGYSRKPPIQSHRAFSRRSASNLRAQQLARNAGYRAVRHAAPAMNAVTM
jgi:hypothetical protein